MSTEKGQLQGAAHDLATHIGRGRVFADNDEPKLARRELDCAAEAMGRLRASLAPALAGQKCTCGHTRHWHGQEIGAEAGSGACESCGGCEKFTAEAPQQQPPVSQGEAERLEQIASSIEEASAAFGSSAEFLRSLAKGREQEETWLGGDGLAKVRAECVRLSQQEWAESRRDDLPDDVRQRCRVRAPVYNYLKAYIDRLQQPPVGREESPKSLRFSERELWNETEDQRVHEVLARLARLRASGGREEALREALEGDGLARAMFEAKPDRTLEWDALGDWLQNSWREEAAALRPALLALLDTNPSPASGGGEEEPRFTVSELGDLLTLGDVVDALERARWARLGRSEEAFDALSPARRFEGGQAARADLKAIRTALRPILSATTKKPEAPTGADLIAAERRRQVDAEGWTAEHDDKHDHGEMATAAARYAEVAGLEWSSPTGVPGGATPLNWLWKPEHFKPTGDPVRDLTKAGALIAAEIDRLHRASPQPNQGPEQPKGTCPACGTNGLPLSALDCGDPWHDSAAAFPPAGDQTEGSK